MDNNGWIKVEDELPPHDKRLDSLGEEVLVWPRNLMQGSGATAYFGKRLGPRARFYKFGAEIVGITHWQPLPAPPTETEATDDKD